MAGTSCNRWLNTISTRNDSPQTVGTETATPGGIKDGKKPYLMKYFLRITLILSFLVIMGIAVSGNPPSNDDCPLLPTKSSISSLKAGLKYIEAVSGENILPKEIPMPLMDPDYFDYGDWAFYADTYVRDQLRPFLNGHGEKLEMKPLDLSSSRKPVVEKKLGENVAIVRVEYPRHKELERILQKLYFNLFRGPVILSVAYDPNSVLPDCRQYSNWRCFKNLTDPSVGGDGDAQLVYVDWSKIHTVAAFLDNGRIRIIDNGKIHDVDHNALVAQANAMLACPDLNQIVKINNNLNYLIQIDGLRLDLIAKKRHSKVD